MVTASGASPSRRDLKEASLGVTPGVVIALRVGQASQKIILKNIFFYEISMIFYEMYYDQIYDNFCHHKFYIKNMENMNKNMDEFMPAKILPYFLP